MLHQQLTSKQSGRSDYSPIVVQAAVLGTSCPHTQADLPQSESLSLLLVSSKHRHKAHKSQVRLHIHFFFVQKALAHADFPRLTQSAFCSACCPHVL